MAVHLKCTRRTAYPLPPQRQSVHLGFRRRRRPTHMVSDRPRPTSFARLSLGDAPARHGAQSVAVIPITPLMVDPEYTGAVSP